MDHADWLATRFEQQRPHLRAVAYRMLGSFTEADDAVQNAWLRLSGADTTDVDNLAGWLTTVVARECLKMLRTRRCHREEPLSDIAIESSADGCDVSDPEAEALLADAVGPALMVVLDRLSPAERLAFVLHDIFAVPFDEIAPILERSPAATRQLASRARRRVRGATPSRQVDLARQRRVVVAFLAALREGDFDGLLAVLDPDVLLRDSGAGFPPGAPALMRGARAVGAHALTFSRGARFVRLAVVNGAVGLAIVPQGRLVGALGFTFKEDKVAEIEMISDLELLRHVDLAALDR
ncbi:sigma-70 family RNA polymerase sigma factor [Microbispora sp. KK1-11]|uniref:sigma-70 family RNA polymerase sigma factor n=1 Tax=Microbispora sp. KK1-11 TaxID=2053005 RepID=UPI00115B7FD5|nr:sigma-70 family RNA polymerase sigma factor [Microbispora sp. KK1-11]TQS25768.1 sigma-70 family RNA polymerase sigma factor [Microbispora sp. KK1-11]